MLDHLANVQTRQAQNPYEIMGQIQYLHQGCLSIKKLLVYVMIWEQLRPNRQEVHFSGLVKTKIASYMQSIPSGIHHMRLVHIKSAILQ